MKQTFFLLVLLALSSTAFSQGFELPGGGVVVEGDTLELIKGSINKQQYRYVYINQGRLTSNTIMDSQFDGKYLWIKEIKLKKNKNGEKESIAYLDGTPFKIECKLKEALRTGEVKLRSGLWKDKSK